ncbi:MAG: cation:proton antiporter [Spirochaetales bacterium]|nr:cation:proton antiporter [Spirochaetales bacterium]
MLQIFNTIINRIPIIDFNILLFLGAILFLGSIGGRLFQKIKFPQVVGYIVIGIIIGQTGIHIITKDLINTMHPISSFALGIIGFMIGSELKIKVIRKYGIQFSIILLLESLTAFVFVSILVFIIGIFLFKDIKTALATALLLGSIASATAPAATTDVLWENKTKGPLTTMVLGLVAMDDGVALLLFSICSSIAAALIGKGTVDAGSGILLLVYEIVGALLLGSFIGSSLSKIIKGFVDEDKILVFSLSSLLLLIGISQVLNINMLLATMSMGFFISNFAPRKSKDTFHLIQKFSPPIYILFFVLVGAELNVSHLTFLVIILAALYLAGRVFGKFLGAYLGSKLSKAPPTVRKYLGLCLMSQAGVAIGLAILSEKIFAGSIGDIIIIVITTTTFVVQLAGPPLVKLAAIKSGEAGLNVTEDDLLTSSTAADLVFKTFPAVESDTTIKEVLNIFSQNENHYYAVVDREKFVQGIITIENLKSLIMTESINEILVAHDIMEPVVRSCLRETPAVTVREELKKYKIPCMPIVDKDGHFIGMVEERSIDNYISGKIWELNKTLESLE